MPALTLTPNLATPDDFYADIFRAQLSTPELIILYFNCVSEIGRPMQRLAILFKLFDNMPIENEFQFGCIAHMIDKRAFGTNTELLALAASREAN